MMRHLVFLTISILLSRSALSWRVVNVKSARGSRWVTRNRFVRGEADAISRRTRRRLRTMTAKHDAPGSHALKRSHHDATSSCRRRKQEGHAPWRCRDKRLKLQSIKRSSRVESADVEADGAITTENARSTEGDVAEAAGLPLPTSSGSGSPTYVERGSRQTMTGRDDDRCMRMALRLAELAHAEGEVPVGAVLAETVAGSNGKKRVLATARNGVEQRKDASAHAEMLCLQAAAKMRHNWRLAGSTLYVTVEPCVMCLSAAQLFRVDRVVFGAPNPNLGACGGWIHLQAHKHPFHDLDVQGGVLADECALLLRRFFQSRRLQGVADSRRLSIIEDDDDDETELNGFS